VRPVVWCITSRKGSAHDLCTPAWLATGKTSEEVKEQIFLSSIEAFPQRTSKL
jgi:hypothetical protein